MKVIKDISFAEIPGDNKSAVLEIQPNVFSDSRGFFCEVLKQQDCPDSNIPVWLTDLIWIKQINRSVSKAGTVRGCHAQKGKFFQAKLVQALTTRIYDIITDARPDSETFGVSNVYLLDPEKQNQLFIPKGFLHAFVVDTDVTKPAVFEYFCDEVYDKASETGVNPISILPKISEQLKTLHKDNMKELEKYFQFFKTMSVIDSLELSPKDISAQDYEVFMQNIKDEYARIGKVWYR